MDELAATVVPIGSAGEVVVAALARMADKLQSVVLLHVLKIEFEEHNGEATAVLDMEWMAGLVGVAAELSVVHPELVHVAFAQDREVAEVDLTGAAE